MSWEIFHRLNSSYQIHGALDRGRKVEEVAKLLGFFVDE